MNLDVAPLVEGITNTHNALLEQFDPDICIAAFDELPEQVSYHQIPSEVSIVWSDITTHFGEEGFDAFQRVTLLRLIGAFEERAADRCYSRSIRECFEKSFGRIVGHIEDPSYGQYRNANDILYKDLGLCRQKLFPAGARVVGPDSGFHRSLMFRGGLRQALGVAKLLLDSGGNRNWYQTHTHLSELEDFNPEGWEACYLRLAEMLKLNRNVRGVWGGSWFYDPVLEQISPRLVYLRSVPQQHGAKLFFSQVDINGGALSRSGSRKKAYEAGDYLPKSYALIWPRKAILEWAAKVRDGDAG